MGSIKSGGIAAARNGQYKKRGALPQGDPGSIKSGGAAAATKGQYKKRGRSRKEIRAVKIDGAASQYKHRGRYRSENWSV